jgi:beta-glucan synthesis-associated protein KRE6
LNPFFYGVALFHKPKSRNYQSDAISANLQLNGSFYDRHHIYRVEWEPPSEDGTGGYIKWFTDNKFVFAVYGESLEITKTEIPSEPMYMIMNTAVSYTWGFPMPCPDNCPCDCYECGNPQCLCALPAGYCDNFPAGFEIDYVRVYQAVNESKHVLGCSPISRPTAQYIEGHAKRYMEEGQTRPLLNVRTGGETCSNHNDCGGSKRGECSESGVCLCLEGWTGPSCRAHAASYDFDTSAPTPVFSRKFAAFTLLPIPIRYCLTYCGVFDSEQNGDA